MAQYKKHLVLFSALFVMSCVPMHVTHSEQSSSREEIKVSEMGLLEMLIGKWEGTSRTWFEPGKLADESSITGQFEGVLNGRFVRHSYASEIRGKPRHGEEMIAFNAVTGTWEMSWVDDFHMNYAIMFSTGSASARGFSVRGNYDVGASEPQWGWRTDYELLDKNHLKITAYNVDPEGNEAQAIETMYKRVK